MADGFQPANPLYWDTPYEIVLELRARYPEAELETLGLNDIFERVIALPNFADDPALANDEILSDILREWYEEISGA
ncbi:MAG: Fe-S cluster assembly protein IscX [Aggregatilineales bacterium]